MDYSSELGSALSWDGFESIYYGADDAYQPQTSPNQGFDSQCSDVLASYDQSRDWNIPFENGAELPASENIGLSNASSQSGTTSTTPSNPDGHLDLDFEIVDTPDFSPTFMNDQYGESQYGESCVFPTLMLDSYNCDPSHPIYICHNSPYLPTKLSNNIDHTASAGSSVEAHRAGQLQAIAPAPSTTEISSVTSPKRKPYRATKPRVPRQCDLKYVPILPYKARYSPRLYSREKRKKDKPAKCKLCPKAFAWDRDLARHCEVHHSGGVARTRFVCPYPSCFNATTGEREAFTRLDNLTRHITNKHVS
ncbi:zinc finger MSN2 [Apiospora sp. TS-2023a]